MDRRIEQEWKGLVEVAFNGLTMSKAQYREMRQCFYSGFFIMFNIFMNELPDVSENEIDRVLEGLQKEADEFMTEIRLKAEAALEKNKSDNV